MIRRPARCHARRLVCEQLERRYVLTHDLALFELEGDAVDDPSTAGDDWSTLFPINSSTTALASLLIADPAPQSIFTGGGSKDTLDLDQWRHTSGSVPDKDEITNAYASAYVSQTDTGDNNVGDRVIYFGMDRFANNGAAEVGFWFFQESVALITSGPDAGKFAGRHVVGDVLALSKFTQGGAISTVEVYRWVGAGGSHGTLDLLATGVDATVGGLADDAAVATVNSAETASPWPYQPKFGVADVFPPGSFFEGGINLNRLGLGGACFSSYLAETRTSGQLNAQLKDFVIGDFAVCSATAAGVQGVSKAGDAFDFQVTLTNTGAAPLYLEDVGDLLLGDIVVDGGVQTPDGVVITSIDVPASCHELSPGESCTITVTRVTQPGDPDPLTSTTLVTLDALASLDGPELQLTADHTVDLFAPAVRIDKTADRVAATVGDTVQYTVSVTNLTDGDLTTPAIDGVAPPLELAAVTDTLLDDSIVAAALAAAGLDLLDLGESNSVVLGYTVLPPDRDPLSNTIHVLYHPRSFPNDIIDQSTAAVAVVDAAVTIAPLSAVNGVGEDHALQVAIAVSGGVVAAGGATVTAQIDSGPGQLGSSSCQVAGGGAVGGCGMTLNSNTAGVTTVTATASIPVDVDGDGAGDIMISRTTDGSTTFTGLQNSSPANKQWVDGTIAWQKVDGRSQPLAGAEFQLLQTHRYDSAGGVFVDIPDVPRAVLDNGAVDDDPTDGQFRVGGLPLGRYRLSETTPPPGHLGDAFVEMFDLTTAVSSIAATHTWVNPIPTAELVGVQGFSKAGDPFDFQIALTNTGTTPLYLEDVGDPLLGDIVVDGVVQSPDGVLITSIDVPASCHELSPGESCTITVTRLTQAGDPDPMTSTTLVTLDALASLAGPELQLTADHTVDLFAPAVRIHKTADRAAATFGDTVQYTLSVTNLTDGDLTTPAIDGAAPPLELAAVTDTLLDDSIVAAALAAAGLDTLDLGESNSVVLGYTVLPPDRDPLSNTIQVLYHPRGFPNDILAQSSASVAVVDGTISWQKVDGGSQPLAGAEFQLLQTHRYDSAGGVFIDIPDVPRAVLDNGAVDDDPFDGQFRVVGLPLGRYRLSETTPPPGYLGDAFVETFDLTITVSSIAATHTWVNLIPTAELVGVQGFSKAGDPFDFQITLTNTAAAPLYLEDVGDPLLGDIVVDGVVQIPDGPLITSIDVPVSCHELSPGESCAITVTRVTQADDPDPLTSTTLVTLDTLASRDGPELHLTADHTVDLFAPVVRVEKTADVPVAAVGDVVTYTITIANWTDGDLTTPAIDGVAPPLELASVSDTLTSSSDMQLLLENAGLDTLSVGESGSLRVEYLVQAGDRHPLTNTFGILYHPRGFPNRVEDTATATVRLIDARVFLTPGFGVNGIGERHPLDVVVIVTGGVIADGGALATLRIDSGPGSLEAASCGVPGGGSTGSCQTALHSSVAGTTVVSAVVSVPVDLDGDGRADMTLLRETDGGVTHGGIINGPPSVKQWVAGSLDWTKRDGSGQLLGGATFELVRTHAYASDTGRFIDISDLPLEMLDNAGADVDPAEGRFLVVGLPLGRYVLREQTPPAGYLGDPFVETIELTTDASAKSAVHPWVNLTVAAAAQNTTGVSKAPDPYEFAINVSNTGQAPLYLKDVSDPLLGDLVVDGVVQQPDGSIVTAIDAPDACLPLPPGADCTIRVTRRTQFGDPDPLLTSTVIQLAPLPSLDGPLTAVTAEHVVDLFAPELSVLKRADRIAVEPGDRVRYEIEIANLTDGDLTTPQLDGTAPPLVLAAASDSLFDDSEIAAALSAAGLDSLELGESGLLSLEYIAAGGDVHPLRNTVQLLYHPLGFPNQVEAEATVDVALVDAAIHIAPAQATNGIGEDHPLTGTVQTRGGVIAVGGATVTATVESGPGSLVLSGCEVPAGGEQGSCPLMLQSLAPGTTVVSAMVEVPIDVDGDGAADITLTRSTDGAPQSSGLSNSSSATKQWVAGAIAWEKRDDLGQPLAGATFRLVRTHAFSSQTMSFTDIPDETTLLLDNGAGDGDPAAGGLVATQLPLGRYVLSESSPPAGYLGDAFAETIELTTSRPTADSSRLWVNSLIDASSASAAGVSKAGDPFDFEITITNTGAVTLYVQDVSDPLLGDLVSDGIPQLPDGVVVTSIAVPADCLEVSPSESCTIVVTRRTQVTDPDPLETTSTIVLDSQADFDGQQVVVAAEHAVDLFAPAVRVEMSTDVIAATAGGTVQYTIFVENLTDGDLTTSGLDGAAPPLVLDTVSDSLLDDAAVRAAFISAGLDELAIGESGSVELSHVVMPDDDRPLVNTIEVLYHPLLFPNEIADEDTAEVAIVDAQIVIDPRSSNNRIHTEQPLTLAIHVTGGVIAAGGTVIDAKIDAGVGALLAGDCPVSGGGTDGACQTVAVSSVAGTTHVSAAAAIPVDVDRDGAADIFLDRVTDRLATFSGLANSPPAELIWRREFSKREFLASTVIGPFPAPDVAPRGGADPDPLPQDDSEDRSQSRRRFSRRRSVTSATEQASVPADPESSTVRRRFRSRLVDAVMAGDP